MSVSTVMSLLTDKVIPNNLMPAQLSCQTAHRLIYPWLLLLTMSAGATVTASELPSSDMASSVSTALVSAATHATQNRKQVSAKTLSLGNTPPHIETASVRQQQRRDYLQALKELRKGNITTYRKLYNKLSDYPLKPYLKYTELRRRLYLLPYEDVDQFLYAQENTYLANRLLKNWLRTLAKRKRWHSYLSYYSPSLGNTKLACLYMQARLHTGDATVFKDTPALWNVGKSQPKACDPVFKAWIKEGYLTPELAWERHSKAMKNRKLSLARYIAKQMPEKEQKLARLYQEVHRYPQRLKNRRRFSAQTPEMQEIIHHGIKRYARKDPLSALYEWERYDAQQLFDEQSRTQTQQYLVTRLAKKGQMKAAERLLSQTSQVTSHELLESLIRDSLHNRDWAKVYKWIRQLPEKTQQSDRWIYWRARAIEKLQIDDPTYPTPQQIYASLALKRSFYGFLSADILGHEYTIIDTPVQSPKALVSSIANLPGIRRAQELFILNDINRARGEWFYATRQLDPPALLAAGTLAENWGWYRKSIQAMMAARHWDDLQLRFPLAYKEQVHAAAEETDIKPTLLFAIARQESAFAADAKSPAGAMGLMQLMPTTAKQTARRAGLRYRYHDLLKPERNIDLGSKYLNQLLDQFDGNRILATAAYNAGPHRVKKWLANSDQQLSYDIWIETIPFKETRGYVQNVLAFSVIYGYRMGSVIPMITPDEAKSRL